MKAKGFSNSALARSLATSPAVITRMMDGTQPGTKHLPKIAEILGCTVEWLTTGTGPMPTWAVPPEHQRHPNPYAIDPATLARARELKREHQAPEPVTDRIARLERELADLKSLVKSLLPAPPPSQPTDLPPLARIHATPPV